MGKENLSLSAVFFSKLCNVPILYSKDKDSFFKHISTTKISIFNVFETFQKLPKMRNTPKMIQKGQKKFLQFSTETVV